MFKIKYIFILFLILISCSKSKTPSAGSLINTSHLEHLFQKIEIDQDISLGTIWIYSNAPDYQLVTDDDEGFTCVDDVSRALVFYCRQYKIKPVPDNLDKIESLTRFLLYMKADNGYYYNFMFPDNGINSLHINSRPIPAFWSWRVLWALTELNLLDSHELDDLKTQVQPYIEQLINNIEQLFLSESEMLEFEGIQIPSAVAEFGADQIALIMICLTNYYQINNSPDIKDLVLKLGHYLIAVQHGDEDVFPYFAFMSWKNIWHAWGNMSAYALLNSGHSLGNDQFIAAGLNEVKHFYSYCIEQAYFHNFRIIRKNDSLLAIDVNKFPQISYDIRPMIFASLEAYNITEDESYAIKAGKLATWYLGDNPASQVMYDHSTGRSFDGIDSFTKTNYNSGAESTIEALLSIQAVETNVIARQVLMDHFTKMESVSSPPRLSDEGNDGQSYYPTQPYTGTPDRRKTK